MFENAQWKVTDYGLEAKGKHDYYAIPKAQLPIPNMDWEYHMAGKRWVDQGLFKEAFNAALKHHHGVEA